MPDTVALWQKVTTTEDPAWTERYHSTDPAEKAFGGRVEITTTVGEVVVAEIAVADAHPLGARPFAREQYVAKFRTLAAGVLDDGGDRAVPRRRPAPAVADRRRARRPDGRRPRRPAGHREHPGRTLLMLYATTTARRQARRAARAGSPRGRLLQLPGAFNPLSARLIEAKGFDGVYVSGAVLSADLGLPDIGLTTATEVTLRAGQIARMTGLPAIVDADTGFGEPMNVARTVQGLEDAGLAGCHIEDQVNPKRCGHLDGKAVVDDDTALKRIRAAVDGRRDPNFLVMARTDIRAVDGLAATIDRAKALVDAGADAIFPEALTGPEEFAAVRAAVDVPLLANMTEFGKGELLTARQLEDLGMNIVIYPVTLLRLAMGAAMARARHHPRRGHAGRPAGPDADARRALRAARLRGVQPLRRERVQLHALSHSPSGTSRQRRWRHSA